MSSNAIARLQRLAWIFTEKFGLIFLSIFSFFVFSYFLTPYELGIAVLMLAIAELVSLFFSSMIDNSYISKKDITPRDDGTLFWVGLLLSTAIAFVLALLLARFTFDDIYFWHIMLAMTYLPLQALARVHIVHLRRDGDFKSLALRTLLGKVVGLLAGCALAVVGLGVLGFIVQSIFMAAISSFLILLKHRRHLPLSFDINLLKETFILGFPAALKSLSENAVDKGIIFALSIFSGPSAVGLFNFANRLVQLPAKAFSSAVMTYGHPVLSRKVNNKLAVSDFFLGLTQVCFMVISPLFVVFSALGDSIVELIFLERWWPAGELLQALALIAACSFTYVLVPSLLVAYKSTHRALYAELISTAIAILVCLYFASSLGAFAGVVSIGVKLAIMLPVNLFVAQSITQGAWKLTMALSRPFIYNAVIFYLLHVLKGSFGQVGILEILALSVIALSSYLVLFFLFERRTLSAFWQLFKAS
ncbi:oligosaccharide flippase family protein [Glaciecola sp. MH2013]|uniref:oligosaccharide flippase family protein n=1 Tax=Glaciecola sp. MH2013 TaxID=2785524 RepID=UPI00189DF0D4|nr:oligosaccharide flippase family protein [Glaciecola sp. MH2013]MBF7074872.1 oligosaccharide flippase family protein [Glaciecola sp. MH2013]